VLRKANVNGSTRVCAKMPLLLLWNNALLVEKKEMRYLEGFDDIDIQELPPSWPLRITEDGRPNSDQHHNPEPECRGAGDQMAEDGALDDSHGDEAPEGRPNSDQHHNSGSECCGAGDRLVGDGALDDSPGDQAPEGRSNSDQHEPECCDTGDQMAGNGALGGRADDHSGDTPGDLSDLSELSSDEDTLPPGADKAKKNSGKSLGRPSGKTPTKSKRKATAITGIGSVSEWPIDDAEMERLAVS
jgi:hypothetical protein